MGCWALWVHRGGEKCILPGNTAAGLVVVSEQKIRGFSLSLQATSKQVGIVGE